MLLSTSDLQHLNLDHLLSTQYLKTYFCQLSHYNGPPSLKNSYYKIYGSFSNCAMSNIFSDIWGRPQPYFVDDALAPEPLNKLLGGGHREILGVVAHPPPPAVQVTGPRHGMSAIRKYAKFRSNILIAFL